MRIPIFLSNHHFYPQSYFISYSKCNLRIFSFFRHCLLCDIVNVMLKPRFEDPIDSAKQLIENNITLFTTPGSDYWVQFLANSPILEYQTLSKRLILAKDWDEYNYLIEHGIIGNGTHAQWGYGLGPWEKSLGRWWKGNLVLGDIPYTGYLSDKKWHLNEASDIFSFIFC